MDDTTTQDAWLSARVGNAIDVLVDRVLARPQLGSDPSQAYGVDGNGNIYQLGQVNGQVVAQVNNGKPATANSNLLLIALVVGVVFMVAK
jgi:hypothetical protein